MLGNSVSRRSERRSEHLLADLLTSQGWDFRRPPHGNIYLQNEYRDDEALTKALSSASKSGTGHGLPEALIIDPVDGTPLAVIEAKASIHAIGQAVSEAQGYGNALRKKGFSPLAIGLAGTDADAFQLRVSKWSDNEDDWVDVTYEGHPIDWIPNEADLRRISAKGGPTDIRPTTPPAEVLAQKADEINRLLREADIKDEYRPTHVAAFMLALWHSRGNLRRDSRHVLQDVNDSCSEAFRDAGKFNLSKSITVDKANTKLRAKAPRILNILERLNVTVLTAEHDYLGQLYETFFRYTGGNTIGQYFTPRHIARLMVDACQASSNDVVADLACGTGGFFVAYMSRLVEAELLRRDRMVEVIQKNIIGFEAEPNTAALCVANMILRGDGSTKIKQADSIAHMPEFPSGEVDVVLMNPPFPHKKTDAPVQAFVERGLEALRAGGRMAVIVPASLLSKGGEAAKWREKILRDHSLTAVCQLPDELFQPFASVTTSIIFLEKRRHDPARKTVFVRLQHDGLVLRKSVRVTRPTEPNQIPDFIEAIANKTERLGFSSSMSISGEDEWSAGAYITSAIAADEELKASIDVQLRRMASFYTRYAAEIVAQRQAIETDELRQHEYRNILPPTRLKNAEKLPKEPGTIGGVFDIYYGMKELHSREGIGPGKTLIISPTENYNGTYGWLDFPTVLAPNFVTVAQTGSIGEAFVQLEPCAVNDDCLILLPKGNDMPDPVTLVLAAATLHAEKWRFNYGRKLTPTRIAHFKMPISESLENWVADRLVDMRNVVSASLAPYMASNTAVSRYGTKQ